MFLIDWLKSFQTFVDRRDNPTQVTAEQAGTYTKDQIAAMIAAKTDLSDIPISVFGVLGSDTVPIVATTSPVGLRVNGSLPYVFSARRGDLNGKTIPITQSGVNYIYLGIVNGNVDFLVKSAPVPEALDLAYIGTATLNGSTVLAALKPFIRLSKYRLAVVKQGSSIPVSTGLPTDAGTFPWQV